MGQPNLEQVLPEWANPTTQKIPVGSFWWKEIIKLFEKFKEISICQPNRGNTVSLWTDIWIDEPLKDKYPQLFSFTRKPNCSVSYFINQPINRVIYTTVSPIAEAQLVELISMMQDRSWETDSKDKWTYRWGSETYSSKKAYKSISADSPAPPIFKWLWASSNLGTHKFFF